MARYAQNTKVPTDRSIQEILHLIERFGAEDYVQGREAGRTKIIFRHNELTIRLTIPNVDDEREERRLWRCLAANVKAKLVAVEEGIELFEEAFMPHVMTRGGKTVGEHLVPLLREGDAAAFKQKLLPGG